MWNFINQIPNSTLYPCSCFFLPVSHPMLNILLGPFAFATYKNDARVSEFSRCQQFNTFHNNNHIQYENKKFWFQGSKAMTLFCDNVFAEPFGNARGRNYHSVTNLTLDSNSYQIFFVFCTLDDIVNFFFFLFFFLQNVGKNFSPLTCNLLCCYPFFFFFLAKITSGGIRKVIPVLHF